MAMGRSEREQRQNGNVAIAEYEKGPLTPELVTKTFQTIWKERGELAGVELEVTPCPFTEEELGSLENKGLRLGYLPLSLATQESRYVLGKMFPKMQDRSVQGGSVVTNDQNPSGWFAYEKSINAPYRSTTERQLTDRLREQKRNLLSENQYIVAGQDSKLFAGKYLDEGATLARLGSRGGGALISACFFSNGRLFVDWTLDPRNSNSNLGGRSSGVNRA